MFQQYCLFKKKREQNNNNQQKDKNEKQTKEVIPSIFSIDKLTHVILQSKTNKFTTWNCLNQTNVLTCGSETGLGFVCAWCVTVIDKARPTDVKVKKKKKKKKGGAHVLEWR